MCGIFSLLSLEPRGISFEALINEFKLFENVIKQRGPNSIQTEYYYSKNFNILLVSSVLWLQGVEITVQPLKSDNSIFIYNGDIFGGSLISEESRQCIGDTKLFFQILENTNDIIETLSNSNGPYAFIYLNKITNVLYFGRDKYGRRSLLLGKDSNHYIITSVAKRNTKFDFVELPCVGVFSIDLNTKKWEILPWKRKHKNFMAKLHELENFLKNEICVNHSDFNEIDKFVSPNEIQLKLLQTITSWPPSTVLKNLSTSFYLGKILKLKELLENSVRKRITTQPKFCQNCFKDYNCKHSVTGVLFSGGVDCAILALLANNFVDQNRPIDLINVAFENANSYNTPDRLTALSTLEELRILCPLRNWNFVEVNVTREDLEFSRRDHISDLIHPLNSILDDSLGCALWFAAGGKTNKYQSPCRTLLVGMGADELFGGYTRHRAAFQKNSWEGLHNVLEEDWENLPHRNLARDDRVVSDHGRQLRTPYLDEEVVEFVQSLDCWERTFPTQLLPQGIGEKILLRSLAYHLGLRKAAELRKRALQFGSRIANSKEKGHEIAERLFK